MLRVRRAQANVLGASDLVDASASVAAALSLNSRLPESLLLEWLQMTGGLLLAGRLADARVWLVALTTITPAVAATANPLSRRVALIALLALELIEPVNPDLSGWLLELRSLRWLPASVSEHSLWNSWLERWLMVVAGRLEAQPDRDANRCSSAFKVIIAVLPALEPPKTQNFGLFLRLEQLRQGIQPDRAIGDDKLKLALNRFGHDPQAVIALLALCCDLNDRALADLRPTLEHQFDRFSAFVLSAPQLLTLHPAPDGLRQSLQQRQFMLDQLQATRRLLAACTDALPQQQRALRHWLLLASEDLPQCVLFRVEQKRQQLESLGCAVRIIWREQLEHWDWSEALLWAHAVIVCRLPATVQVLRAIKACRLAGLPTWYDLNDLVVDPK